MSLPPPAPESGDAPPPPVDQPDPTDDPTSAPGIVVYLVDPFTYGPDGDSLSRLAMIGLLRCYQQMVLPDHLANNLSLQVSRPRGFYNIT